MKRLLLALMLFCAGWTAFAQGKIKADVKNFQAEPNQGGRRMLVKGESAASLGNGVLQLIKPHVETFRADNTPDTIIDAAECFFQQTGSNDVWGDKDLKVRTADGHMTIRGVGFLRKADTSQLTISNRVEATIQRQAFLENANATNKASANLEVTSDRMEYSADSVVFRGNVRVKDPQGDVQSDTLTVRFETGTDWREMEAVGGVVLTQGESEARGRRATYTRANGLFRLSENTKWKMADREGESELLIWDRTNNTLRAETKVRMTMAASLLKTNLTGATAQGVEAKTKEGNTNKVTITADTFDYAPTNVVTHGAIAIYNGNVHAADPQANLDCELLTIFFGASNRLARAIADRSVKIGHQETEVRGEKAVFENDEVTVTGKPSWTHQNRSGTSDVLVFNPSTRAIRAHPVRLEIPNVTGTNLLSGSTASTNVVKQATTNIMVVTAMSFTNVDNVATFYDHVRANDPRGQIDADRIAVYLDATNRVERILASGDVILTESKMQAIGQEADYDLKTESIRLTGKPRVFSEGREIIAREFLVDRKLNHFIPVAPYWAKLVRESSSATNRTSSSK